MKTVGNYTSQNPSKAVIGFAIAIGLFCVLLQLTSGDNFSQGFDFLQPFPLRVAASQWIHLSWQHLLLNLAGLAILVWGLGYQVGVTSFIASLILGSIWIGFYLTYVEPINWYCGLSGLLHFLIAQWLVCHFIDARKGHLLKSQWPLLLLTMGLIVKLALEHLDLMPAPQGLGGPVAYEAHRAGAVGGALLGSLRLAFRHWKN